MRLMAMMLVLCAAAVVSGEPPAGGTDSDTRKTDELFLRTGILLNGIPVVWRIRQDAREDLLRLLRFAPDEWDLNGLLDDPELMDIFKDFVRYIAIPDRERRQAEVEIE